MNNQFLTALKSKMSELSSRRETDSEVQRNAIREELQYYVLDFVYHHPDYRDWIMYGGSAVRICYGLNRMSVDLDFEIDEPCAEDLLRNLKTALEKHFATTYEVDDSMLVVRVVRGRGVLLKFLVGGELGLTHPSKQIHVKIDLNYFTARKTVIERIPITHDQLSFVITTYNMSALMASKIAALLLRGRRGVGKATYEEKGRDVYDLLWYMQKKTTPKLDYLNAKGIDVSDLRTLFNRLTIQMNKVSDANLRQDLLPLFIDQRFIENWLQQWRESYFQLLELHDVTVPREVLVREDFRTDNISFIFVYETEDGTPVRITYTVTYELLHFSEGNLPTPIDNTVIQLVPTGIREKLNDKLKQYVSLFYRKTENYLEKTHKVVLGDSVITKTIRTTADNLNQKEQIVLNKSALLSCELEDLLR